MAVQARAESLFSDQLHTMGQVITALIIRETKTRYGHNRFGYVWALVEPTIYIAVFLVVRSQLRVSIPFGESLILFILAGLLVFRLFMSVANRGIPAIRSNKAMLAYPLVKPIDVILARITLELLTMYVVVILFFCFLMLTAENQVIVNHENFAGAIFGVSVLSIGVSYFNAIAACIWPTWERIWGLMRLPLLLLSGIFYVPSVLPKFAQDILWWNPVLHCVEWMRTALYLSYDPTLSIAYVLIFASSTLCLGLLLERLFKSRILAS